ncbi:TPA: twin-arginine translocation signal domain-containing protein [Klebsiella variicola subsp. variicola]|nr:twin-arginine translocation signal domain-containing protein [Klebsiella pneumoniae]
MYSRRHFLLTGLGLGAATLLNNDDSYIKTYIYGLPVPLWQGWFPPE